MPMQISSADKRRVYLIIVLGLLLCVAAAARIVVDIVTLHKIKMQTIKSPLRYPGGKSRGAEQIRRYFPHKLKELVSPFIGGGSIELQAASCGTRVYGYDAFLPVVDFWQALLEVPAALTAKVLALHPMTSERYKELQTSYCENGWVNEDKTERAARYYAMNRSSFSGIGLYGSGMSPKTERFQVAHIRRLAAFRLPTLSVAHADFRKSLLQHPNTFAYCDPPYFLDGKRLYGKLHTDFDHALLAQILRNRKAWLLSYDDCPEVRQLYSGFRIETVSWSYGMASTGKNFDGASKEVVILSADLEGVEVTQPAFF